MATIRDVARAAGVSVSTISHVINGTRHVAPETAARVRNAIEQLRYAPDGVAQALKARKTRTVGMVVSSSTNPFFAEVIRGVENTCFERGYSLILCNSDDVPARLERCLGTLRTKRIDGLIVMTACLQRDFLSQIATDRTLPTVLLDSAPDVGGCVIADDSVAGGRLAAEFLLGRGFSHIGYIDGPPGHPRSGDRISGFLSVMSKASPEPTVLRVGAADLSVAGGYRAMTELLARGEPLPEAIFCVNDMLAMGLLCAAHEQGIAVPGRLSVMGYDDIELAAYLSPPLTTIRQFTTMLGARAAEVLLEHLDSGQPLPHSLTLQPALVERRSVGHPGGRGA